MSPSVPSVTANLSGVRILNLSGFRGQEDWGRWTVGKTAAVELWSREDSWVEARFDVTLPYPRQSLRLLLNKQAVESLNGAERMTRMTLTLPLQLSRGRNEIKLITDKSNLDPRLTPFAPQDLTDMAVSVQRLQFQPLQVFTDLQAGKLYRATKVRYPSTYQIVDGQQINFFLSMKGSYLLRYRLLGSADKQEFRVFRDGQQIHKVTIRQRGTLVNEQLSVNLDGRLHRFTIESTAPTTLRRDDSLAGIEKVNGAHSFYVQNLAIHPITKVQTWEKPLAVLGVLTGLILLLLLLFKRTKSVKIQSPPHY